MAKQKSAPPSKAPAAQPVEMHKRDLSKAANIIKQFEGLRLKAYKDSGGVWTIGYGTIKNVKAGMVITKEQADTMFEADFMEHMIPVQRAVTVQVNDNEFGAMVSLCYNIGVGAFNKSTLLKYLNQGKPKPEVAEQFLSWTKVNGKVVQGLVNRRQLEKELFLTPIPQVSLVKT